MTTTNGFHNTIYLHGPHDPTVTWVEGPDGFASINTSGASILVKTAAEADALIRAAVAAKELLLGVQEAAGDGEDIQPLHQWRPVPPPNVSGDLDAIPANRIGEPA